MVECFPKCYFLIHERILSPSKLLVKGICVRGEESSEFNLVSPTSSDCKFEVYDHYLEDPGIIGLS